MRKYYLVLKRKLVLLPDSVEKANANAPISSLGAVITPLIEAKLISAGRI